MALTHTRHRRRTSGVLVLTIAHVFVIAGTAQIPWGNGRSHSAAPAKPANQQVVRTDSEMFPCTNPKMQKSRISQSKHSVKLSWSAGPSIGHGSDVAGYNLYRLNPDGSCTKLNAQPVQVRFYVDQRVAVGTTYRYAAKAVNHARIESRPSKVVTVTIPPT